MNHRMEYDINEGARMLALATSDTDTATANKAWDKWFDWSFRHAKYIMDSLTALRALHELMAARKTLVLTYDDEDHEYALVGFKSHGEPREWTGSRLEHVLRNAADDLAGGAR